MNKFSLYDPSDGVLPRDVCFGSELVDWYLVDYGEESEVLGGWVSVVNNTVPVPFKVIRASAVYLNVAETPNASVFLQCV